MPPKRKETHPVAAPQAGLKTPAHERGAMFVPADGVIPLRFNNLACFTYGGDFLWRTISLRVPSSRPSVSLRFRDLHGPVIALPCGQGVAQQFLNFLPLPQGQ